MLLCYIYTETSRDIVLLPVVLYAFPRIVGVFGTGHHFPFTFFIITKPVGCYCYDKKHCVYNELDVDETEGNTKPRDRYSS